MKKEWQVTTLGEVCEDLFAGGDVPKYLHSKSSNEKYNIPIFTNGETNMGLYGYTNKARVTKPSLTISARGTIGYSEIRYEPFYPAVRLIVATPKEDILDIKYLKYVVNNFDFVHSGTSIPQLTVPMVRNHPIHLPPLTEQKRIVKTLDKKFEAIEKLKNISKEQLDGAKELFESRLKDVLNESEKKYKKERFEDVCEDLFAGGDAPKGNLSKTQTKEFNVPIFSNGEKNKGLYGFTDTARVTKPSLTISARGTIGYTEIREEPFLPVVRLIVAVPAKDVIELRYLKYVVRNMDFTHSGSAIPQLTIPMIRNHFVPLPPLNVQMKLVNELDVLFEKTKKLEVIFQKKIAELDELKKAYLHEAFSGKL